MKKLIAFLIVCSVLMMPLEAGAKTMRDTMNETYSIFTEAFPDVPQSHLNFNAVAYLVEDEIIQGYPDGTFKPDGQINRAEMMKMVVYMFFPDPTEADKAMYQNCFPDIHDEWYAFYVCKGEEQGWISGYTDGTFKAGNNVSRVEAIKIILNAMIDSDLWPSPTQAELAIPLPSDTDVNGWYTGYLQFAIVKELLDGQHVYEDANGYYYKPNDPMTRKEVAEMMYRAYLYMIERVEYAEIISNAACFQLSHPELSQEESYDLWFTENLEPIGYTQEDVDLLAIKYISDDVLVEFIEDGTQYQCGDAGSVDMTKWNGFLLKYAR